MPANSVERRLCGLRIAGPSGEGPLSELHALHLDRQDFDRRLAIRAAQAGADVLGGICVKEVLPSGGVTTDDGPLRASVTIFADGANSLAREVMPTMRNSRGVSWGLSQLFEIPGLGESSHFEVRFGSFAPGWRTQLNPLGGDRAARI